MADQGPAFRGPERLADLARAILAERRRRVRSFDASIFGEPAWDILLALFGSEPFGRQTIGQLIRWTGVPQTTALRWIAYLEDQGLVLRRPHPTDLRTVFIELSPTGREQLAGYLTEVNVDR
jgi:DNA-binding MarR family transcriptional regulator